MSSDDMMERIDERRLRTAAEVADEVGLCTETIRRLHRRGELRAVPGVRKLLFTREAIDEFFGGGPGCPR